MTQLNEWPPVHRVGFIQGSCSVLEMRRLLKLSRCVAPSCNCERNVGESLSFEWWWNNGNLVNSWCWNTHLVETTFTPKHTETPPRRILKESKEYGQWWSHRSHRYDTQMIVSQSQCYTALITPVWTARSSALWAAAVGAVLLWEPGGLRPGVEWEFYGRSRHWRWVKAMTLSDGIDLPEDLWVYLRQAEAICCCMVPMAMDVEWLLWDLRSSEPVC